MCVYNLTDRTLRNRLKIINTSHAHIHLHKNLRRKIHSCTNNTYFNLEYLWNNVIRNYAGIKIPKTSPALEHKEDKTQWK
jgi:hypothetical protein